MSTTPTIRSEALLRRLAESDESSLRSLLAVSTSRPPARLTPAGPGLSRETSALIHLAALVAVGGSTTSLRWAVELAERAGADDDAIVEVLATIGAIVGAARIVAVAPRLALAIGYDIEVEGWDGS